MPLQEPSLISFTNKQTCPKASLLLSPPLFRFIPVVTSLPNQAQSHTTIVALKGEDVEPENTEANSLNENPKTSGLFFNFCKLLF